MMNMDILPFIVLHAKRTVAKSYVDNINQQTKTSVVIQMSLS